MKYYKILIQFRREYQKLNYLHNKQTLADLYHWAFEWCRVYNIPENLYSSFFELAMAYSEKEWHENFLYYRLKEARIEKLSMK